MTADEPEPQWCGHLVGNGTNRRYCKVKPGPSGYCHRHAKHPQRQVEAVTESLNDYVQDAIKALGKIVKNDGGDIREADIIKAALGILDRTGHGPAQTLTIEGSDERLNELIQRRRGDDAP